MFLSATASPVQSDMVTQGQAYFWNGKGQWYLSPRMWCCQRTEEPWVFLSSSEGTMSSVDDHLERINFDDTLWESALSKLRAFFADFILPELFTRKLRMKLIVKQIRNANANTTKPEYSIIVQTWRVTSRTWKTTNSSGVIAHNLSEAQSSHPTR